MEHVISGLKSTFALQGLAQLCKSFLLPCEQASANSPGGVEACGEVILETFSHPWNHEN